MTMTSLQNRTAMRPEVAGEAGMLLDADDVAAWAKAMGDVLMVGDLREKMVANGRIQARKFSWQKAAEQTLKLYTGN